MEGLDFQRSLKYIAYEREPKRCKGKLIERCRAVGLATQRVVSRLVSVDGRQPIVNRLFAHEGFSTGTGLY
jgi:hypothetical protein